LIHQSVLIYSREVPPTAAGPSPLEFLQLVADPHRWQLLGELARSDRRVGELTELADSAQNLVSYHLRQLRSAGLVSARRSSADGRDTYYRLDVSRCAELLGATGAALHPAVPRAAFAVTRGRRRVPRPRVLFLCTGNSARSQIAQALLEERSSHSVEARSAGSHPKPLHPNAVRVMAERGIDIAGRATTHLDRYARTRFDHVITLCDKVREVCPEFPGQPVTAHWSMADPAAEGDTDESSYPAFVRTADEIDTRVELLVTQLGLDAPDERRIRAHR
jgi:protein-tyrosine-phosphatase/DNA-binding transcriptional ArsR family regulator